MTAFLFHYLWSENYRIDSAIFIVRLRYIFNDVDIGRFGIVLLNRLFFPGRYRPCLLAFLSLLGVTGMRTAFRTKLALPWRRV